ncbi:MAG: hypothetical protein JST30_16125 [Armatimonadetes bacterium]|nr:hypothetical protein [Armatimonadota bacterium]
MMLSTLALTSMVLVQKSPEPVTYMVSTTVYALKVGPKIAGLYEVPAGKSGTFSIHGATATQVQRLERYVKAKTGRVTAQHSMRTLSGYEGVISKSVSGGDPDRLTILVKLSPDKDRTAIDLTASDGVPEWDGPEGLSPKARRVKVVGSSWTDRTNGFLEPGQSVIVGHYREEAGWQVAVVSVKIEPSRLRLSDRKDGS